MRYVRMDGVIASCGFASGDRFVVGHWAESPVGPITDVMWATGDGERILLAPNDEAAEFITGVYRFDRVDVGPIAATGGDRSLEVDTGHLALRMQGGRRIPVAPTPRPRWFSRYIEGPIAAPLLGVRPYGVSPTGVHEWYQARWVRRLTTATATVDDVDLGDRTGLRPATDFGFSEPPAFPAMVAVRPVLGYPDPSG